MNDGWCLECTNGMINDDDDEDDDKELRCYQTEQPAIHSECYVLCLMRWRWFVTEAEQSVVEAKKVKSLNFLNSFFFFIKLQTLLFCLFVFFIIIIFLLNFFLWINHVVINYTKIFSIFFTISLNYIHICNVHTLHITQVVCKLIYFLTKLKYTSPSCDAASCGGCLLPATAACWLVE